MSMVAIYPYVLRITDDSQLIRTNSKERIQYWDNFWLRFDNKTREIKNENV